jgi:hypothetical protein
VILSLVGEISENANCGEAYCDAVNAAKYISTKINQVVKNARSKGIAVGGHSGYRDSLDLQIAWAKAGANIILHCSDAYLSANQLNNDLNQIKKSVGDQQHLNTSSESI